MPRTTYEVEVLGLEKLQELSDLQKTLNTRLLTGVQRLNEFKTAATGAATALGTATPATQNFNRALSENDKQSKAAGGSSRSLLTTLLGYKALSIVSGAFADVTKAMGEYEKQTLRVARVTGDGSKGLVSAELRANVAKYGVEIKDAGEGMYQLGTQIKDTNALLSAQDTLLKLLVGTQADSRDTARAMIQIYAQFPDAFAKGTSEGEKYRRIGELIAVTFKNASAEVGEIANSLKYLGPIAEAAKIPLAQVMGIITGMTAEGVRGRMAGTEATAFVSRLIKSYDSGLGGVETKGKVYHFEMAKTAEGGIDLLKTLENIVKVGSKLPIAQQREYYLGITNSTQATRFLGTQSKESLKAIEGYVKQADDAMKGLTHQTDDLAKTMQGSVFAQAGRAWSGMLANMSKEFEDFASKLHLTGLLRDIGDMQERGANYGVTDAKIKNRSLAEDAQIKQSIVLSARRYLSGNPSLGVSTERGQLYTLSDLDAAGPHTVSGFQYQMGDKGGGVMSPLSLNLLKTFLKERGLRKDLGGSFTLEDLDAARYFAENQSKRLSAAAKAAPSAAASGGGSLTFRHAGDAARVNPNLVEDLQAAAEALGLKLEIGTAITGHDKNTINGKPSRHSNGNAFDITRINGLPANVNNPAGAALVDKLVAYLKGEEGFGFGEGRNSKGYLWRTQIGGDHTNHLHVSDITRADAGDSSGAITDSPKTIAARKKKADAEAKKRLAAAEKAADEAEQKAQEARKDAAEKAAIFYEAAAAKRGPFDPTVLKLAQEADAKAMRSGDINERLRLRLGLGTKTGELAGARKQAAEDAAQRGQTQSDAYAEVKRQEIEDAQAAQQRRFAEYEAKGAYFRSGVSQGADARLRALNLSVRPNRFGADGQQDQLSLLTGKKAILEQTIAKLGNGRGPLAPETLEETKRFKDELAACVSEIRNLKDAIGADGLRKYIDKFTSNLDAARSLMKTPEEVARFDETHINPFDIAGTMQRRQDSRRAANAAARQESQDKYDGIKGGQESAINGSIMGFLHGGSFENIFKTAGDSVVNAALEKALKEWNDPLIEATTNSIAGMEGLQRAVEANTAALEGGAGDSSAGSGSGGAAGRKAGAGGKGGGRNKSGKYLSEGLAAYSVFSQGQETGVSAGGILGGALTGFETAGPWGALAGGALSLLGGLFGRRKTVNQTNLGNPALSHAPGDFDFNAYRYRATGELPSGSPAVTGYKNPTVVNAIYIDGVKQAVRTEVKAQTGSSSSAQTSAYFDYHRPIS